jgi:hypothetical protein
MLENIKRAGHTGSAETADRYIHGSNTIATKRQITRNFYQLTSRRVGPKPIETTQQQLRSPDVLKIIFSTPSLRRALKRIATKDKDDLITHPLKALVLTEYEVQITEQLVRSVPAGTWSPTGAYISLTSKRSGAYRELVFPTLIDGVVGRCIIDAIEPLINADDDGKTFSGRSHFSNVREPGNYDDWFQVWQDFTAAIDKAAHADGYTYVFDTDINDFFPSVDKTRAKALLAARTGAHPSLLELLFYCLEAWLPRFAYAPMTGLPVEPNDVSRVVAHAYLKSVDAIFKEREDCIYLRYVDDTVIFCKTNASAHAVRRLHHLELRQLGLNPNAAKSQIMTVSDFQHGRHRDVNIRLQKSKKDRDIAGFDCAAKEWFSRDHQTTTSWDKIAKMIYSLARQLQTPTLRDNVVKHATDFPGVAPTALRYLASFDLTEKELRSLLTIAADHVDMETSVHLARTILDARVDPQWSPIILKTAIAALHRFDERHGAGYLKAQWLLIVHKYGAKKDRDELEDLGITFIDDAQWRLHYLYVSIATKKLRIAQAGTASSLANSDIQLALRLCGAAVAGKLSQHALILKRLVVRVNGKRGIQGRHLPFLRLLLDSPHYRTEHAHWLKIVLGATGEQRIADRVVTDLLRRNYKRLTA